ncbi:autotransporter family protein [Pandoraea sp. PE-S2T-3]|uniref:autotransporter family protein n=2 Tax=unclassified Pandoraea TaxID=2624094 RepID=UPI000B3F6D7F|nr:autotransporter outer membrane beta-barrel domain-containing protein [Pandoraea sp. PE-S2T-3]
MNAATHVSRTCPVPLKPIFVALSLCAVSHAQAACDNLNPASNTTVTCTGSGGAVLAQSGGTNVTVNVTPGSTVSLVRGTPGLAIISVDTSSTISNSGTVSLSGSSSTGRGAALLGQNDRNALINTSSGTITTSGANNDGMALNGNNGSITNNGTISLSGPNSYGMTASWGLATALGQFTTFVNTGTITATGSSSRAISATGGQSTITNTGTLLTTGGTASGRSFTVYMQGNNITFTNSGYVEARGINSDAVVSNTGGGFTGTIVNQAGGQIISQQGFGVRTVNGTISITNAGLIQSNAGTAIAMNPAARSNTLTLQTGSQIIGTADGGSSAVSTLILQGTGTASNAFVNFGTLLAQGDNWTWSGSGNFNNAQLQTGTFNLTGTLGGATTTVASGATLIGTGTLTGNVTNQGTVHPGDGSGNGTVTIVGNYTGQNGTLKVDSVLGNDSSRVAPLTVSGGTINGNTSVAVNNLSGLGNLTTGNGIPVVQAVSGATSTASAFALGSSVSAGAYTYYLYKGGTTADSTNSWYLRSTVAAPVEVTVTDPVTGEPEVEILTPTPGIGTPPTATLQPGDDPLPIYRIEVPVYSMMPELGRTAGFAQLATFHERQGQQGLLDERGWLTDGWARVWGQTEQLRTKGDVTPQFDGNIGGIQIGHDVFASRSDSGHGDHVGILGGWTRASGDVQGLALGMPDTHAGSLGLDMYSAGLYWTHVMPGGAYTDAIFLASSMQYQAKPLSGLNRNVNGKGLAASLETGWPIHLSETLALEPQAQIIWQRQSIDDFNDGISTVAFNNVNSLMARIGARLEANYDGARGLLRPYLLFNLIHSFGNDGRVLFGGNTPVVSNSNSTAAQFGIGVAGRFNKAASVYATLAYLTQLDATRQQSVSATLGLRWTW